MLFIDMQKLTTNTLKIMIKIKTCHTLSIALSANGDKIQLIDSIETSKNLVCKKDIKSNYIIKQCITKENINEHNPNQPQIHDHTKY